MGAKFHIYKVNNQEEINDLINNIINNFDEDIQYNTMTQNGFNGVLFFNESSPSWTEFISEFVEQNIADTIWNRYSSYILFRNSGENTYIIAGGNGHIYIKDITEKDFGLNLVPKLVNNEDNVIKKVVDNPFIGNRIQIQKTNRKPTNILNETDFSNVYRELILSADENILNEFGLDNVDSANIINKDFISIEKTLNLDELITVLDNLNEIYQRPANFALNPFKTIKKTTFKASDLKKLFINYIQAKNFDSISLDIIGLDISSYLDNELYEFYWNENFKFELNTSLEWPHIKDKFNERNFTKKDIEQIVFHTNVITRNENGEITLDLELFNCLKGFILIEEDFKSLPAGSEFYLLNGNWYILDDNLNNFFDTHFNIIYEESREFVTDFLFESFPEIKNHWDNLNHNYDENIYNDSFVEVENIIMAHRYKQKQIEIADLIVYDETNDRLVLICFKNHAGADGCRDLLGQIESSSYYVRNYFVTNLNNEVNDYYNRLYNKNNENMPITEDKFIELFRKGQYCYIAGFLDEDSFVDFSYTGKVLIYNVFNLLSSIPTNLYLLDYRFELNQE